MIIHSFVLHVLSMSENKQREGEGVKSLLLYKALHFCNI